MSNSDRLTGPDFLDSVADQSDAQGLPVNAAEFRQRATDWRADQARIEQLEADLARLERQLRSDTERARILDKLKTHLQAADEALAWPPPPTPPTRLTAETSNARGETYTFDMIEDAWGDAVPLTKPYFNRFRARLETLRQSAAPPPAAAQQQGLTEAWQDEWRSAVAAKLSSYGLSEEAAAVFAESELGEYRAGLCDCAENDPADMVDLMMGVALDAIEKWKAESAGRPFGYKRTAPPSAPVGVEDVEVLKRLRAALPDVGLNGWWLGVEVLDRVIATLTQQAAAGAAMEFDGTDREVLREFIRICREHKPVGAWPGERVCKAIERAMDNEKPFRFIAEADMAPEREPSMKDADRMLSGPRRRRAPPPAAAQRQEPSDG